MHAFSVRSLQRFPPMCAVVGSHPKKNSQNRLPHSVHGIANLGWQPRHRYKLPLTIIAICIVHTYRPTLQSCRPTRCIHYHRSNKFISKFPNRPQKLTYIRPKPKSGAPSHVRIGLINNYDKLFYKDDYLGYYWKYRLFVNHYDGLEHKFIIIYCAGPAAQGRQWGQGSSAP